MLAVQAFAVPSLTVLMLAVQAFAVTPDVRTAVETAEPFALHGVTTRLLLLALLKHRVSSIALSTHHLLDPPQTSSDSPGVIDNCILT